MKGKLGFIILLILIQSYCYCQDIKPDVIDLTSIEKSQEKYVYVHEIFDSLSIVHPSNVKEGLIGRIIIKSYIYKNFLIISSLDYVQVYDLNGSFIFRTFKGKGPNELRHVSDFTVDYDNDELLVLDAVGKQVVRVKFNGEYIGAFKVKRGSYNLSYLGSNKTCYYVPFNNYQEDGILYDYFYIQDYDGVTYFTKKFKREIDDSPWIMSQYFMPYKNGYTFKPDYSDTVLFINHEGFHNFKIFDYQGTQMPERYMRSIDLRRKHGHEYIGRVTGIFTDTYSFYVMRVRYGYNEFFVYDEKNSQALKPKSFRGDKRKYNGDLNGKGLILGGSSSKMRVLPIYVNYDGSFLMVCDIEDINNYALGQDGSNNYYKSLIKSLKELDPANDNPVIIRGYIKN